MPEIIYGRNPVLGALQAGQKVERILIAKQVKGPKISAILSLARQNQITIEEVPRKTLAEITRSSKTQGIVAFVQPRPFATLEDIMSRSQQLNDPPLLALLDGIEDPHNLGAILRSADGAGLHGIILPLSLIHI